MPNQFAQPFVQLKNKPRRLLIIIGVAAAILLAGGLVWYFVIFKGQLAQNGSNKDNGSGVSVTSDAELSTFVATASGGDVDGALKSLEAVESKASSDTDKVKIQDSKYKILYDAGRYDDAAASALVIADIEQSHEAFSQVAMAYEQAGDKAKALEYYKKALTAYDEKFGKAEGPINDDIRLYYETRINALGA